MVDKSSILLCLARMKLRSCRLSVRGGDGEVAGPQLSTVGCYPINLLIFGGRAGDEVYENVFIIVVGIDHELDAVIDIIDGFFVGVAGIDAYYFR